MVDTNNPFNLSQLANQAGGGSSDAGSILGLLIANIQDVTQAINNLNTTLETVFPQQGATVTSATGGSETLPTHPVIFLEVVVGGTTYAVPLYTPA